MENGWFRRAVMPLMCVLCVRRSLMFADWAMAFLYNNLVLGRYCSGVAKQTSLKPAKSQGECLSVCGAWASPVCFDPSFPFVF